MTLDLLPCRVRVSRAQVAEESAAGIEDDPVGHGVGRNSQITGQASGIA